MNKSNEFIRFTGLLFYIAVIFWGCISPPDYPDTPQLEFRSISKSILKQGIVRADSLILQLYFTDGDGNFGASSQENTLNIFMIDKRTGNEFRSFKAPAVPDRGASNGIAGTIDIKLYSTCCIYPEDLGLFPCDISEDVPENELYIDVYIVDRDNNASNTVTVGPITLLCI